MDEQQLLALKPELDRFLDRFAPFSDPKRIRLMHAASFKDSSAAANDGTPRTLRKR